MSKPIELPKRRLARIDSTDGLLDKSLRGRVVEIIDAPRVHCTYRDDQGRRCHVFPYVTAITELDNES